MKLWPVAVLLLSCSMMFGQATNSCKKPVKPTPPPPPVMTGTPSSNSTSSSSSSATATSSSTATGGNASATGGNSTSSSGGNSQSQVTNQVRQTPMAYAPEVIPTVPCFKGMSGGVSSAVAGLSLGGGKVDENCRALQTTIHAPNRLTYCKLFINLQDSKKAHITMEDCMGEDIQPVPPAPTVVPAPEIVVVPVPAPVVPPVAVAPLPMVHTPDVIVTAPRAVKYSTKKPTAKNPNCPSSLQGIGPKN